MTALSKRAAALLLSAALAATATATGTGGSGGSEHGAHAAQRRGLQTTDTECEAADISSNERLGVYFDVASLTCEPCPGTRLRSEDGLYLLRQYCECDRNNPCAVDEVDCPCKAAAGDLYPSRDGTRLMTCRTDSDSANPFYSGDEKVYSAAAGDAAATDCKCVADNHYLVEFVYDTPTIINPGTDDEQQVDGEKRCTPCAPSTFVDQAADRYECRPCTDSSLAACACPAGETNVSPRDQISLGDCVAEALFVDVPSSVASSYYQMEYIDVQDGETDEAVVKVVSSTFKQIFWPQAAECFRVVDAFTKSSGAIQLERTQACQALANLCVLQDYNLRDSSVCKLFEEGTGTLPEMIRSAIATDNYVNEEPTWLKHLPWLYRDARDVRSNTEKIKLKVGFDAQPENGIVRTLSYKLATWSLDGTWLGFEDLTTQLDICSELPFGTAGNPPDYLNVGYGMQKDCTLNITSLLDAASAPVQKFYDLYLVDADGTLVATATKLLNYRSELNDEAVNLGTAEDADLMQFTGRFVLFDHVSAMENNELQVFRYPKSVKLSVKVTELGKQPSIFTPIVTIEYGQINVGQLPPRGEWDDGSVVDMSFSVEYVKDLEQYKSNLRIIFAICCTLCACEWGISVVLHSRNRPSGAVDGPFLLRSMFEGIGCSSRWMFLLMFFGCFQQWFFFKMQAEVNTLLPTADDIEPFRVMLTTGFLAKLISLGHVLWRQCQVDVFFIDWEKSHGRLVDAVSDGGEDGGHKDVMAPVSYWRTLFITNEWAELQTVRMVNVELTLLGLVFLLRGLDLDNLATSNPDVEDLRGPEDGGSSIDPVLHFFIGSFFIMLLSGAQMAFKKVFYHRYVHDPLEAFIDLMYAANLSSIILSDVHCGYYLGGDGAPHAHMDTDMHHIKENLKAETKARTKPRGISPLTPNIQSFILFITPRIRQLYEGQFTRLLGGVQHSGIAADEKGAINAYGNLNKLFRKFIKTSDPESDYAHTFLPMTSGMRLLPMYNPEIGELGKLSLFYEDTQNEWQSVVLYGIEGQLMTLLCWSFCWFRFMTGHTTAAACFAYVLHLAMTRYRATAGEANLARKTLVDPRFLT